MHSGSSAQEYNTFFATHTGGLYQRVPVTPNTQLRFGVFVYVWSSAGFENSDVSESPNTVLVRVGIDPTGGTDGTSPNVVWSTDSEFYDQYRELTVTATAQGSAVTVFIRSAPQGFVGTTNIYVDDASLFPLGQVPPTAAPAATATPDIFVPTQEGTPTVVPSPTPDLISTPRPTANITATPRPSSTPNLGGDFDSTITYVVRAGDTVSAIASRYNSSVEAIGRVNGLSNVGLIYVGQTLVIPVRSGGQAPLPTFTPIASPGGSSGGTSGSGSYVVQAGDTLFTIATRFKTTVATLAQLNNILNPNLIHPGQTLIVPGAGTTPLPTPVVVQPTLAPFPTQPPLPTAVVNVPQTHVVQPGENLFRISLRYNVSMQALAAANGIYNLNLVFTGQVLIIPR